MSTKASRTTFGISVIFTSVRRSSPTSATKRPSTAYTFDVWRGVYVSRIWMGGHRPSRQTRTQLAYAMPPPNATANVSERRTMRTSFGLRSVNRRSLDGFFIARKVRTRSGIGNRSSGSGTDGRQREWLPPALVPAHCRYLTAMGALTFIDELAWRGL